MVDSVIEIKPGTAALPPFKIRPCQCDPVIGLFKDRLGFSPLAGALLFLLLYFGGNFLLACLSGTAFPRAGLDLAYLQDRVALVVHLFFVPVSAFFMFRFYEQTEATFERLYTEGLIRAPREEYQRFLESLHRRYNSVGVHLLAVLLGLITLGFWQYQNEHDGLRTWRDLNAGVGAIYHIVVAFIAWYSIPLLLLKAMITARAMQRMFDWPVNIQPFHPDGCGGLRVFTEISVTIALFTALAATAIVVYRMSYPATGWIVWIAVGLLILTPLIFLACLYRAHDVMSNIKESLLRQINQQVHPPYEEMCAKLSQGEVMSEAAAEVLRLEELHAFARRLPVWPTDTQTVGQVALFVAVPLILLTVQIVFTMMATKTH